MSCRQNAVFLFFRIFVSSPSLSSACSRCSSSSDAGQRNRGYPTVTRSSSSPATRDHLLKPPSSTHTCGAAKSPSSSALISFRSAGRSFEIFPLGSTTHLLIATASQSSTSHSSALAPVGGEGVGAGSLVLSQASLKSERRAAMWRAWGTT
eukprot:scaffold2710_cov204-Pinguiococcus_pyrenoidosus.AAC.7